MSSARWEWGALSALGVVLALPLWLPLHLPFVDLPQHVAVVADLARYAADPALAHVYERDLFPATNVLLAWLAMPLTVLLGAEDAVRAVLSAGMVAFALALGGLARAAGGRPIAASAALPFAYGDPLVFGFLNFWLSIPAFVLASAAALSPRHTWRSVATLAIASTAAVAAHAQMWLVLVVAVPMMATWVAGKRGLVAAVVGLVPSMALFVAWAAQTFGGGEHRAGEYGAVTDGFGAEYEGLSVRLSHVGVQLLDWMRGDGDLVMLGLAFGVIVVAATRAVRSPSRARTAAAIPALLCFAAYLLAPIHLRNQYYVATRMLLPAVVLLGAAVAPAGRSGLGVGLAGTLLTLVWTWNVAGAFRGYDREARGLDTVLAQAAPGGRMLGLPLSMRSAYVRRNVFLHAPSWYTVERGGENAFSFALFESSPLRFREPGHPTHLQPRSEKDPWCELLGGRLAPYEYYLVRAGSDPCGVVAALDADATLVAREHDWALYAGGVELAPRPLPEACRCPAGRRGEVAAP